MIVTRDRHVSDLRLSAAKAHLADATLMVGVAPKDYTAAFGAVLWLPA